MTYNVFGGTLNLAPSIYLTNGAVEVKRSSCMFVCVYRNCELNCCDISDVHNLIAVGTSLVCHIFFSRSWFFQRFILSIFQDLIRRRIGCDGNETETTAFLARECQTKNGLC